MAGKPGAYCKLCKTHIRAHHSDLLVHKNSAKHKTKEQSLNRSKQSDIHTFGEFINFAFLFCLCTCLHVETLRRPDLKGCLTKFSFFSAIPSDVSNETKSVDIRLAVFVAIHSSVRSIDHMSDLLKELGKGSPLEKTKLHRTKCLRLISAVVAPAFLTELVEDVGDCWYALIIDEATDISVNKFMGICIRYFSKRRGRMVTDFLGIVQVTSCTGLDLAIALKDYLKFVRLELKKLEAIGTDGAPNMCGAFNSLYSHLKAELPNLVLLKCICHSISKCAEWAVKVMPDSVTFILAGSHNYFAHSAKKLGEYSEYYKVNML